MKKSLKGLKLLIVLSMAMLVVLSGSIFASQVNTERSETASANYDNKRVDARFVSFTNRDTLFVGECYTENPFLFHLHSTRTQIHGVLPMMLMGYSLYDFPESKWAVIDFVSRYPSAVPIVSGMVGRSIRHSWYNENYFDVNGNAIARTEFGTPYGFYIFDLDYDGIPEIVMFYLAPPILGHPSIKTVVYQYRDGMFRPMPVNLYSLTSGVYFATNTPIQGEYRYTMSFAAMFYDNIAYFNNSTDKLYMFTTAHEFDIAGEWHIIINNGVIYFEPVRVIRDSESLG